MVTTAAIPAERLLVVNATVVTMAPLAEREGTAACVDDADLGIVRDAALVVADGRVRGVGRYADLSHEIARFQRQPDVETATYDAAGAVVLPGLVDAHTHALFCGERVSDFESLIAGETPRLGIGYTVERTRAAGYGELMAAGTRHLAWMRDHGTTTAEVKSGYALDAPGEMRMLAAMADLDSGPASPHVVATFCGAHALPPEFHDYDEFVDELCRHILPSVAASGIARFGDAFCERGYFSVQQSRRFLSACAAAGLGVRLHADELNQSGGALLAAELRASSADHLNFVDSEGVSALAASGTIAVLCPATGEYLDLARRPPARQLIEAGVRTALATDFNPGTSPCFSLQRVAHLARRRLGLSAAETLAALTVWPAISLGARDAAGSLRRGHPADLIVLEVGDFREFGYYDGGNIVRAVLVARPGRPAFLRASI
ncbi:MAG: imidazolonepropionase [Candidatus Eremiobacteraeota bacterium]|nr:imidazolonepropionase [Candidatus Eremiobacteraeota bacterium]MBC5827154.1 imidazolonepropionase [Candidatus Eremiobacteraeota bacterium]